MHILYTQCTGISYTVEARHHYLSKGIILDAALVLAFNAILLFLDGGDSMKKCNEVGKKESIFSDPT